MNGDSERTSYDGEVLTVERSRATAPSLRR